jgi:protein SCO1/2
VKKKLVILVFLLSFPSVFYVILTTGKHNFTHLPFYGKKELAENRKDTIYHTIPPFKFVNQNGDIITNKMYDGKIYVASYFSASNTGIYPKITTELLRVQAKFAYTNGLIQILSHTINPENDSVPVLKAYANMVHADDKVWNFVTGDKKQLVDLARTGYLLTTPDSINSIHIGFLVLVDKEQHIRGMYDATKIQQVNFLLDAIKVLMAEYFIKDNAKKPVSN